MKQTKKQPNNLILVVIFGVIVLFLIGVSLIIKFVGIIQESTFDGEQRYTVLLSDRSGNTVYVTVDPSGDQRGKVIVKNAASVDDVLEEMPIAVDGIISISTDIEPESSIPALIQTALIKRNDIRYNITFVDLMRLYLSAKTASDSSEELTIELPFDESDSQVLDGIFLNQAVIEEGMTVSIVNATAISGVAGRLEDVLKSMGAEVISVETAVSKQSASEIIYFGAETYTLSKIQQLLGYTASPAERMGISDISIIIGEDGLNNLIFGSVTPGGEI